NNWNYPVVGTPARGVAGVQQFFEAMRLSKPPKVQLSQKEIRLGCRYSEPAQVHVTLQTTAKKWVYGQVTSDTPWLRVLTPSVAGPQHTTIGLEVDPRAMTRIPPEVGQVQVLTNGGQKLTLSVQANVQGGPSRRRQPTGSLGQPILL